MQPTLGFLLVARPATGALARVAGAALHGAVPVTDTPVALVEQLVARDLVRVDVPFDEGERPREERVQLNEAGAVDLERLEGRAVRALRCATAVGLP